MNKKSGPSVDGPGGALRLIQSAIGIPKPDGGVGLAVAGGSPQEGYQAEVFNLITAAGVDSAEFFTSHFCVPLSFILPILYPVECPIKRTVAGD